MFPKELLLCDEIIKYLDLVFKGGEFLTVFAELLHFRFTQLPGCIKPITASVC